MVMAVSPAFESAYTGCAGSGSSVAIERGPGRIMTKWAPNRGDERGEFREVRSCPNRVLYEELPGAIRDRAPLPPRHHLTPGGDDARGYKCDTRPEGTPV